MKRRSFIELIQTGGMGLLTTPLFACFKFSKEHSCGTERNLLKIIKHNPIELSKGKRLPFGWPAIGIAPGESILVEPDKKLMDANLWLRISVAQEIWDEKLLHVHIPETEIYLGVVDIRFSSVLVPYELEISGEYAQKINRHGLELELESKSPLWIFSNPPVDFDNSAFHPYILNSSEKTGTIDNFLNCFTSVNSIQAFGWREGAVLDGLWQIYSRKGDTKALEAIKQHLALYFDDAENLVYENSQSFPWDNRIDGIESTIPFATLARIDSSHPILNTVVEAWQAYTKPNGMVIDGKMISAEGCYTVAYPMAVIGKALQRNDLKQKALEQLKHRFVLIDDNQFYLRSTAGNYTYPNWARGAAWFLLGFARTISELKGEVQDEEVIPKFQEGVKIALSMQREDGLWNCFMHHPESLPDTSGSAGIAAAIMTGIQDGFLHESYKGHAEKCWTGLQKYLTPDGYLKGVAQDNRGGMKLQEGDYRVIGQMGMGLMGQLYAAL